MLMLLLFCGPETCCFYIALGLGIIFAGYVINKVKNNRVQLAVFIVSVISVVLLIAIFLRFRIYFQKYFVYLPSLSYLGFRGIAFLVSIYKKRNFDFSAGLMQMFFFPILIMGPISRVENFQDVKYNYADSLKHLSLGLSMLIAGHFCGDYVLNDVKIALTTELSTSSFWLGAVANSFEFYFVFAGYSHLIIGLGLLLGFKLPDNFNYPYLATSISDFWRKWHMSLSFWIRDYVYLPLGGNRKGISRKCFNMLLAMAVCGIWHGLSLHYLLWGLYHGLLLSIEGIMKHFGFNPVGKLHPAISQPIKIMCTFALVTFGWLLFKYSIPDLAIYLKGMAS